MKKKCGDALSFSSQPEGKYKILEIKPLGQNYQGQVNSGTVTIETPSGEKVVKPFPAEKK